MNSSISTKENKSSAEYSYSVIFQPLAEGGYEVLVPAIPEICTYGNTLPEARRMAKDAIRCFLESALTIGEPIPKDLEPATEHVAVILP